ncbi:SecDF P1 head subdomain-containing protein [Microbacter margulisiae]|uniref:Preprotein translocase subunit SecD n=1 Tax=Microbacter margulisiae TaxID=1350067 RepID=A0A7W5DRM6_9PORP|nr:hypothetical protein [Microbacter margulisiae]MBB3187666.1 preprotein translocase subunit SecD [Microbacter margulisiae]
MKTIIYLFIAICISGIFALGCPAQKHSPENIIIRSLNKQATPTALLQSANIISKRLNSFCPDHFKVSIMDKTKEIKISWPGNDDIKIIEQLATQKGVLAFYTVYPGNDVLEFIHGDRYLDSLLKRDKMDGGIGYAPYTEVNAIDHYLNTHNTVQQCRFVWGTVKRDSVVTLYALTAEPVITKNDIKTIQYKQDVSGYNLNIVLHKSAIEKWKATTKASIHQPIAIVLDNQVLYAPVIKTEIDNGRCSISGKFKQPEVRSFKAIGDNGVLPLNLQVVK